MRRGKRGWLYCLLLLWPSAPAGASPLLAGARTASGGDVAALVLFGEAGEGIGRSNIVLSRVGDHREILCGTSFGTGDYFYALRFSPETGGYTQTFVSDPFPSTIARMGVADLAGNGHSEIVVTLSNGEVRLYDLVTKRPTSSFVAAADLEAMTLGDLDGDGAAEIVLTTSSGLFVYSGTGSLLWQVPGATGFDVTVGQMDDDPGLEIATTGGQVVDVTTRTIQWNWPSGFGFSVRAADVDGDGREELIAANAGVFVWIYDVEPQLLRWTITTAGDIAAIAVADLDCDGRLDLLVGDGQGGNITAYDPTTQMEKWHFYNSFYGVTQFAIGDADGDGRDEIVWGTGYGTSGSDLLIVTDALTQATKWMSTDLRGPLLGPVVGDLDGDGEPELVFASSLSESGYAGGRILVYDARTLRFRAMSDPLPSGFSPLQDLKLRAVDGGPAQKILTVGGDPYDGVASIFAFDGAANTLTLSWTNTERPFGSPFYSVEAADVDLDGNVEIVAAGGRIHTGADGVYIYVYDSATGALKWHSDQLGDYWSRVRDVVVATAGGGDPDLIGIVDGGALYVFDGVTKMALPVTPGTFTALRLNPYGSGRSIYVGDASGNLYRYDRGASGYVLGDTYPLGLAAIDGITPISASGALVGAGGVLYRYDGLAASPVWSTANYGAGFGRTVSVGAGAHARYCSAGIAAVVELGPALEVDGIAPTSGPATGGTAITVTGSSFAQGSSLFVGSDAADDVVVGSTQIGGQTPAMAAGALLPVTVVGPDAAGGRRDLAFFSDFLDVAAMCLFHDSVERMFRVGVTAGCGGGNYCPDHSVTRAQMAVFLARSEFGAAFEPDKGTGDVFADVACGDFGASEIELLARSGVTAGCGGALYCPNEPVTRAQVAVLLLKMLEGSGYEPPAATGAFADVPASDPFAPWIEDLAARGITAGCGGGNYCPGNATTRGQMSAFLVRTFFAP